MLVPAGLVVSILQVGGCIYKTCEHCVNLPWFGIDLGKLDLMGSHGLSIVIEYQKASTGRALVDGADECLGRLHLPRV